MNPSVKMDQMIMVDFESCEVKCPACGRHWITSLYVEYCNCLYCELTIDPKIHIVLGSELEVN
jgi:hypothetical protein